MKNLVLVILLVFVFVFVIVSCKPELTFEQKVDEIFSEFTPQTPGASVLILQNNKVLLEKGYGLANLEQGIINEPKTNFRLASITKQFTALSIMLLENEGKLSFDDSLEKFFPSFPDYGKNITVRQILQHTSGLVDYESCIDDSVTVQLKDQDVLDILMKQDSTYFQPGTKHLYSNSGYAVLVMIIEKLSGKSFAKFLEERIFLPLKMNNSVAFENGISSVENRAYGYANIDSEFVYTDQSLTSAVLGDGGIYSSVLDMAKWSLEIDKPTLLPKEKLSSAFTKLILPNGEVVNYGFGWRLDPYKNYERPYHTGSTSGFSNMFMKIPELNLTIIVLMNVRDYDAKGYAEKITDLFIEN
ncbi:MAG: beta-lactamase family protein [Bacteroidetes bacterium]|nr:beta-lactamase family protein [Bacteroidota bacterium]MBU1115848.1 beta-lactamase family protein [Bacteroidota bacterium]MBU1797962.1 beta-lactamase family protein [Bacteroidota bacterium]